MTAPEINRGSPLWPSDAERPTGLRDGDEIEWNWGDGHGWNGPEPARVVALWNHHGQKTAIRLAPEHPLSKAQTWNEEHPDERPFTTPWYGDRDRPLDSDRGEVLLRDGSLGNGIRWTDTGGPYDIVAYCRTEPATQAQPTVTEGQATKDWAGSNCDPSNSPKSMDGWIAACRYYGIIPPEPTPPTPEETAIAENHGLTVAAVRAIRGEG